MNILRLLFVYKLSINNLMKDKDIITLMLPKGLLKEYSRTLVHDDAGHGYGYGVCWPAGSLILSGFNDIVLPPSYLVGC